MNFLISPRSSLTRSIRLTVNASTITIAIRITPYAIAMSKNPRFRSRAIEVVNTLVSPAKLPPMMVAIPSSPKPLLKAEGYNLWYVQRSGLRHQSQDLQHGMVLLWFQRVMFSLPALSVMSENIVLW